MDSVVNIEPGEIYNSVLLDTKLMFNPQGIDVTSLYSDEGYLGVNVIPVETFVEPDSIDVEVRIMEGSQYRIGKVSITGNTKQMTTSFSVKSARDRVSCQSLRHHPNSTGTCILGYLDGGRF